MYNQNDFVSKAYYSLDLKHQICKEHIEQGSPLRDLVKKYNLSCHSLIHVWLRKLGYVPSEKRQTRSAYIGIENFQTLPEKSKKEKSLTDDQKQIELLKKRLEDANLLAEGYRRMIEMAETELKISIRKKPNTK